MKRIQRSSAETFRAFLRTAEGRPVVVVAVEDEEGVLAFAPPRQPMTDVTARTGPGSKGGGL
jgi:hypothetical protein